jgi:CheY-like chemotaxis protein
MNWSDKSILIAEDEDTNYLLLVEYLEPTGAKIIRASNGFETLEVFNEITLDLILMDMKMPMMSGYEAVRKIRESNTRIPIIAQTAYAMVDDKDKILAVGCNDYIIKPIMEDVLLSKIKIIFKC